MLSILSQLFPNLDQQLRNKTATMQSILSNPDILSIFRLNCDILTDFFCSHSRELLAYAMDSEKTLISDSAYNLIFTGHFQLMKSIIDNNFLNEVTLEVLSQAEVKGGPTSIQLSRIAEIITFFFSVDLSSLQITFDPKEEHQIIKKSAHAPFKSKFSFISVFREKNVIKPAQFFSCEFLVCLMKYLYNLNTMYLFKMLFSQSDQLTSVQRVLAQMRFVASISSDLFHMNIHKNSQNQKLNVNETSTNNHSDNQEIPSSFHNQTLNDHSDTNVSQNTKITNDNISCSLHLKGECPFLCPIFLKMENMFKVIEAASLNPIFKSEFECDIVISCLLQKLDVPYYVVDAQWKTILSSYSLWPFGQTMYFLNNAVKLLESVPNDIHQYHCHALMLLSRMINNSHTFVTSSFLRTILSIFVKFECCTMFHEAVRHFVVEAIAIPEINTEVALSFVPFLMVEAQMRQYGIVSHSGYPILNVIYTMSLQDKTLAEALSDVDGFDAFGKRVLKAYSILSQREYGGPKPKQSNTFELNPQSRYV